MPFRKEFEEAINLVAHAATEATKKGASRPVLVGGAAVELYTGGAITSGDFDLVTSDDEKLMAELEAVGFVRVKGTERQLTHPSLHMAVEFVSGPLMDGKADLGHIKVFRFGNDQLAVIPIEDLIADRLGQAYSSEPPHKDLIDQARKLYRLVPNVDRNYLIKRIADESGDAAGIELLERP